MKKGKILGILAASAVLLTGCVDSMPELTAEQSDMIAEYAAALLLKYSPNYDYKIVSDEEVAAARAAEQEQAEEETQTENAEDISPAENVPQTGMSEEGEKENGQTETGEILPADEVDFAAELGIDDLVLWYQSFEICDSYPQDSSGFRLDAAEGKKLLVVHFDLEGNTEEDVDCDLFDSNLTLRMTINDTDSVTALSTLLANDLATYIDTIPAGETADVVAVAEIDDMTEEDVSALTLHISSDKGSCTAKLK
ncbi:MAG: hypothetical protein J6C19_02960 [Lachnospiraceae bacterium]|nr:hypothetical protein [Lachnospiraceae bacterium]MBO5144481.1 hypothetical protein [Lachnospiraceae bacterium]